jgi:fibro-slime domain-containing protein
MQPRHLLLAGGLAACATGTNGPGPGQGSGGPPGDAPAESCGALATVVRDFKADFPDMQPLVNGISGDDRGIAQMQIGSDHKPVYAPSGRTLTVTGKDTFDEWYRDTPGVNLTFMLPMMLTEMPVGSGTFVYDNQAYFPLDGMGWGDPPIDGHNFYFTTEIHSTFHYFGGEHFTFAGDDDVFVFVNGHLAIDLGGVHATETESIDFDAQASQLGLAVGNVYALDIFNAERHPTGSDFRIETSINCLGVIQ